MIRRLSRINLLVLLLLIWTTIKWYQGAFTHIAGLKIIRGESEERAEHTVPSQEQVKKSNKTLWEAQQQERRSAMREGCGGTPFDEALNRILDEGLILKYLLIDDVHQAMYCSIPKVSSTTWKKVWLELTGLNTTRKFRKPHVSLNRLTRKENRQKSDMKYKLATFTKFIIVRHPFERLLSAYRNKVEGHKRTRYQGSPFRYVKKYRPNATQTDITWPEFVTYLINGGNVRNNHWRPYGTRCHLCAIDYDIIAKYETLVKDSEEFLRRVGAPESLHYPEYHPSSTKDILESYMKKLTKEQIDRLYHTYKQDFKLFQYTYNPQ